MAKPEGNPKEQPCQPEENLVLPESFNYIYILFQIGFHIGPPKNTQTVPYWPFLGYPCQNSKVGEFWCTMAIM